MEFAKYYEWFLIGYFSVLWIFTIWLVSCARPNRWSQVTWRKIKVLSVVLGAASLCLFVFGIERTIRGIATPVLTHEASNSFAILRTEVVLAQQKFCSAPNRAAGMQNLCELLNKLDDQTIRTDAAKYVKPIGVAEIGTDTKDAVDRINKAIKRIKYFSSDKFMGKPLIDNRTMINLTLWGAIILSLSLAMSVAESVYQMMAAREARDKALAKAS